MSMAKGRNTRVAQMSGLYDQVAGLLRELDARREELLALKKELGKLKRYQSSGRWLEDYEADERGEIPPEVNRSVLSQDGLYNLLEEVDYYTK